MSPSLEPSRSLARHWLLFCQRRAVWALVMIIASSTTAQAETKWEVTPYRVVACVAMANNGDWTAAEEERLRQQIAKVATAEIGAAWQFSIIGASAALRGEMITRCGELTANRVCDLDPRSLQCDKWMLIVIARTAAGDAISVRELDLTTRQLGPVCQHASPSRGQLPQRVLSAMLAAFSPLVELERANGNAIAGRIRAAALIDEEPSPLLVAPGAPLLPVLRINDRLGRAGSDQISVLPLTLLAVKSRAGGTVACDIYSASRHRLGARASLRLSRFGLAVRAPRRPTRIALQSAGEPRLPLADYDLLEGEAAASGLQRVASTDNHGAAEVPADQHAWRLFYVRHGEQTLARLPIITGYQDQIVVSLPNNDVRLRAEGFVAALKQEVVDTVARRQILAARLRQRMAAKQFDGAQAALDELLRLTDADEFDQRLQTARTKLVGDNARAQQHIDNLFRETRQSLARYLDPSEIKRLETQLTEARRLR